MLGLMQDYQLLTHTILDHAALNHGEREMVTRSVEGPIRRTNYADIRVRSLQVAKALVKKALHWATAWRRWGGIPTVIWSAGTASWVSVRSATR